MFGAVPSSPESGIAGLTRGAWTIDVRAGVGVVPGRLVGVYSVVWFAVGATTTGQL